MRILLAIAFALLVWNAAPAELTVMDISQPLSELPKSVQIKGTGVQLFADYDAPRTNGINLYLINNSESDLSLRAQGSDVFLKLESKTPAADWKRAQPHAFSDCGISYMAQRLIRKGHYAKFAGYQPVVIPGIATNNKSFVRYRLYRQGMEVISNAGVGLASEMDTRLAENDALTVYEADLPTLAKIGKGELKLSNNMDHIKDLRELALYRLTNEKFDQKQVSAILLEIANSDDAPYNLQARQYLTSMNLKKLGK